MTSKFRKALVAMGLIWAGGSSEAVAQSASAPSVRPSYSQTRTAYEQFAAQGPTKAQHLEHLRSIVRGGVHAGAPRLKNQFGNFQGKHGIDPGIPGVGKAICLTSSANPQVVKGAARTISYATHVFQDPRFRLLAVNEPYRGKGFRSDKDLLCVDRRTGQKFWLEIKDMGIEAQRPNLRSIKKQIARMAETCRTSGEIPVWVNRQKTVPAIRDYANSLGVQVFDQVRAGKQPLKTGQTKMRHVLDSCADTTSRRSAREFHAANGVIEGAIDLIESGPRAWDDLAAVLEGRDDSAERWLGLARNGSRVLKGAVDVVRGISELTTRPSALGKVPLTSGLGRFSRLARRVPVAVLISEGILIAEYLNGHLTERQFLKAQASLVGGFAGGIVGGWGVGLAGAGLGMAIAGPPGALFGGIIGGIIGGVGGGHIGATLATAVLADRYRLQDAEQHRRYVEFLQQHYGGSSR